MGAKSNQSLKQHRTQLAKLVGETDALKTEISNLQKDLSTKQKNIAKLQEKIDQLEHPKVTTISEHAIIRYFERVEEFDMEEIKQAILTDKVLKLIEQLGPNGTYPTGKYDRTATEYRVKIVDNVVVTVLI